MTRKLQSAKTYTGDVQTDYLTLTNVKLVQSFLTKDDWDYLFPLSITLYSYDVFLQAVGEFPKFCGEGTQDPDGSYLTSCKREIATVLAHMTRETGFNLDDLPTEKWR